MYMIGPPTRLSTGHGVLESPLWDADYGLLFSDVTHGGVLALDSRDQISYVVRHRRGIGGVALHVDGGIIVGGRNLALKRPPREGDDATVVLMQNDPAHDIVGYNDLVVDERGRIYVGSLAFVAVAERTGKPGKLHLLDLDGTSRIIADDILLTNGLGFSPDGATLYHADSMRQVVFAYDVDRRTGDVGPRRQFIHTEGAAPDGLTVDSAGTVWVALPHTGTVTGFSPQGREVASVRVTEPMVTSVCFGGSDLRDLYIVSGSEGAQTDNVGSVYRTRAPVPGQPRHRAAVKYVY